MNCEFFSEELKNPSFPDVETLLWFKLVTVGNCLSLVRMKIFVKMLNWAADVVYQANKTLLGQNWKVNSDPCSSVWLIKWCRCETGVWQQHEPRQPSRAASQTTHPPLPVSQSSGRCSPLSTSSPCPCSPCSSCSCVSESKLSIPSFTDRYHNITQIWIFWKYQWPGNDGWFCSLLLSDKMWNSSFSSTNSRHYHLISDKILSFKVRLWSSINKSWIH